MATEEQTSITGLFTNVDLNNWYGQRLTITNRVVTKLSMPFADNGSGGNLILGIRKVSDNSLIMEKVWGTVSSLVDYPAYEWAEVTFDTPTLINEEVRIYGRTSSSGGGCIVYYLDADTKASESQTKYFGSWAEDDTHEAPYIYTYGTPATPTVTTQAVTSISGTTATGNGNITSLGVPDPTAHGVCWNTTGAPTTTDSKTDEGAATATGAFTTGITGLTASTKYYVRAYATNSVGTGYGNQVEFTADKGTVFPINPLLRASGIKRTFWAGIGGQAVYQVELALGGLSTTYVSPIGEREPPSAVKPTPLPSGFGYQYRDYQAWLRATDPATIVKLFGKMPSYEEWVRWMVSTLKQGKY